jgi:hypothetical protein
MTYDSNYDGWTDIEGVDADGDGVTDVRYLATDYDGRFDTAYADSDGDGWADTVAYDLNEDGVTDVVQTAGGVVSTAPNYGAGVGTGGSTWERDQMNAIDGNLDALDQLIDHTLDGISSGQLDTGGVTVNGVFVGSDTQSVLGFINDGGEQMTDVINAGLNGEAFTPEQMRFIEQTIASGQRLELVGNIMEVHDQIMNSWHDQEQRATFGYLQTDSNGNVWHWNPYTGDWDAVRYDAVRDVTIFEPSPYTPPFARG